jgi:hypothetical protein
MSRQYQFSVLLLIISACRVQGQYYFYNDKYYNAQVLVEAGFFAAAFNCLTDLGGKKGYGGPFLKDINWEKTHPGGGIYVVILFDQLLGFRAESSFGKISASDNVLKNDHSAAKDRYKRNLQFESCIIELSVLAEFLPLSLLSKESYPLFSPYLLAGFGVFKFNPRAFLNGQWIDLHPLHTEGQGFKEYPFKNSYKLTQLNFPVGLGLKYEISALLNARFEIVYRFLTTDYIDDVSTQYIDPKYFHSNLNAHDANIAISLADRSSELQPGLSNHEGAIRGNSGNKDAYFSCNIKLGLVLNRKRR